MLLLKVERQVITFLLSNRVEILQEFLFSLTLFFQENYLIDHVFFFFFFVQTRNFYLIDRIVETIYFDSRKISPVKKKEFSSFLIKSVTEQTLERFTR